jgi:hypothetical protein
VNTLCEVLEAAPANDREHLQHVDGRESAGKRHTGQSRAHEYADLTDALQGASKAVAETLKRGEGSKKT